ncbi:hypothetical protein CH294_24880 [Rhodococcus sp. 14-2483-1-1]|nr:hypothetical protein CH286_24630 [Rhodococcus sp. WWJCD1]OZC82299.1 hypothetical protein CH254_29060 [Rhodococcus sp. 06-412-2C]OZC95234.1 hypothetical protein CH279_18415 [Rhodococcus sp. 06-412-2B]OZF30290.1 hypothetical protein CH294_24880 [Rhodococcus sp. 14-2483-1-1]
MVHDRAKGVTVMAEWVKKIEENAKGLIAEAEQELTALEGVDTVDLTADDADESETVTSDDGREQVSD